MFGWLHREQISVFNVGCCLSTHYSLLHVLSTRNIGNEMKVHRGCVDFHKWAKSDLVQSG